MSTESKVINLQNFSENCPLVHLHNFKIMHQGNKRAIIRHDNPNLTDVKTGGTLDVKTASADVLSNVCYKNCIFYDKTQLFGFSLNRGKGKCIPSRLLSTGIKIKAQVDEN